MITNATNAKIPELLKHSIGSVFVPASRLFCHPSRLANTYEPGVEVVHQEAFSIPCEEVELSVRHATTLAQVQQIMLGWRGRLAYRLEEFRSGPVLDLKERLVYDARYVFNGNMAHLIQHHLANLGYLRERLGYGPREVVVVLEGRPASMAIQVFSLLGYEVLKTYLPVQANLVDISPANFFHLLPWLRHLAIRWPTTTGPRKIVSSRKNTRRVINEGEVEALLKERGYEKIYFEDIPILEQWSILRHANRMVAIHGAALGCLPFQASRDDGQRAQLLEL